MRIAYFNGKLVDESVVSIAIDDPGFLWAPTVTDRVRTYNRKLFRLREHLRRFRRSCELCRIPQPVSDDGLTEIIGELIANNSAEQQAIDEQVLILFATPGRDKPTLCLHTIPFSGERYRSLMTHGAKLITPPMPHVPDDCIPRQAKMRSRMHWWLAEQQVHEVDPDASALLLDQGRMTETASANFAIVRDGAVLTPRRDLVLDGLSMRVVEEICGELRIPFSETILTLDDCRLAEEAFLTSTPFGIAGVSSINGRPIRWPGPIMRRIRDAWSEQVGTDIWRQILPNPPGC